MDTVLLVGAVICFALATFGVQARINLAALGAGLWCLTFLI